MARRVAQALHRLSNTKEPKKKEDGEKTEAEKKEDGEKKRNWEKTEAEADAMKARMAKTTGWDPDL